jgi:2-desacetyl-2-hydroxyethyl bacteriochlorophyllide A dehydrogenase
MKAAVFHQAGTPLSIEDVADPIPGAGDLILKVRDCGICGSDLHASKAGSALAPPGGSIMGHEFSGEVVEIGKDVAGLWKSGDRVCSLPVMGCGKCLMCLKGQGWYCEQGGRILGMGQENGAYAEFVRVSAFESIKLPQSVSFREGALVEPLAVGLHAVKKANFEAGSDVLILGAGPIGLAVTLWARFMGARNVVVSERAPDRIKMAEKFGATAVVNPDGDMRTQVKQACGGRRPSVIFECVGIPGMIQNCVDFAPTSGKVVVVGVCDQLDTFVPMKAVAKELNMQFVIGYVRADFEFVIDLIAGDRIDGEALITDVVAFDTFADAFENLRTPSHQCKVMLEL